MVLQLNSKKVHVVAVKVTGEGWVGVSTARGRCHGHKHQTPELAKLCALHRLDVAWPGHVLLLPLRPDRRLARPAAGGTR
jgi:hypothetical protein